MWPALSELVKAIDVSKYQGHIEDWAAVRRDNPEIGLVFVRLAGSTSGIDPEFAHNYDTALIAGFRVVPYVNINPTMRPSALAAWWRAGLGDRRPDAIVLDAESDYGVSPLDVAAHVRACIDELRAILPGARIVIYTGAWWWNGKVAHGWEGGQEFWIAHYPYLVQNADGSWRVAWTFAEADACLPIGNTFTPKIPIGVTADKVIGWQLSSLGIVYPISNLNAATPNTPRVDINYVKRWWFDDVFGPPSPPAPPPGLPISVELRYPAGAVDLKVVEV